MRYLFIVLLFYSFNLKGQELWQLSPWAVDSNYVLGALASGEPYWIHKDSLGITGGGGVYGAGAVNKVAYWAASDSLTYDTAFHWNQTSKILGVGTTSPVGFGSSVHVHGATFSSLNLTNGTTGQLSTDGSRIYTIGDSLYISNTENGRIDIGTNNANRMTITGSGRVGINNTNPQTTLTVGGEVTISSLDSDGSPPTTSGTVVKVVSDGNGKLSFQTNNTGTVTSVGLTTGTTGTDVSVSGSPVTGSGTITLNIPTASASNTGKLSSTDWTTFNNKFTLPALTSGSVLFSNGTTIAQNNSKFFWNNSTERLGIGTNSPTTPLHVEGRGYFNQGSSNLFINGGNTTLSGTSNFALGNSTLTALTTGYQNVGIGVGAAPAINVGYANFALGAQSLNACQGCYSNIAIGNQSLFTNVSGFRNVAIGQEALAFTTTDASTGVGFYALRAQTTGQYNTGIGYFAAYQNTTGSGNVSAGFFSGPVNGGTNVMLGYYAGSGTTGNGNICIGNFAGGGTLTQDNTLYIANSSATSNGIYGNFASGRFGINTAPASLARTLHVTGEVRITDLTTDTPTRIVGADADGDLGAITVGTGLSLSSGTLSSTGDSDWGVFGGDMCNWGATGTFGSGLNTGIGTCSPSRDLDVNGDTRLRGAIYDSGNSAGTSGQVLTSQGSGAWTWTSAGTVTSIATNNGITGGTITTSGTIGLTGQALALHNLGTNGLIARTGAGTVAGRTITAGDGISVTNGDGVSGNPTVTVSQIAGTLYRSTTLGTFNTSTTPAKIDFNQSGFAINATASTANDNITSTLTNSHVSQGVCTCQIVANATGTYYAGMYRNGTLMGGLRPRFDVASGDYININLSEYFVFTNGDVIDVRIESDGSYTNNTIRHCQLAVIKL